MDLNQLEQLVDRSSHLLELSKSRNADDLADKLLDTLCE